MGNNQTKVTGNSNIKNVENTVFKNIESSHSQLKSSYNFDTLNINKNTVVLQLENDYYDTHDVEDWICVSKCEDNIYEEPCPWDKDESLPNEEIDIPNGPSFWDKYEVSSSESMNILQDELISNETQGSSNENKISENNDIGLINNPGIYDQILSQWNLSPEITDKGQSYDSATLLASLYKNSLDGDSNIPYLADNSLEKSNLSALSRNDCTESTQSNNVVINQINKQELFELNLHLNASTPQVTHKSQSLLNQSPIELFSVDSLEEDSEIPYMRATSLQTSNLSTLTIADCTESITTQSPSKVISQNNRPALYDSDLDLSPVAQHITDQIQTSGTQISLHSFELHEQNMLLDALEPQNTYKRQFSVNETPLESLSINSLLEDSITPYLSNNSSETSNLSNLSTKNYTYMTTTQTSNQMINQSNSSVLSNSILYLSALAPEDKDEHQNVDNEIALEQISVNGLMEDSNISFLTKSSQEKSNLATISTAINIDTTINQSTLAVVIQKNRLEIYESNEHLNDHTSEVLDQIQTSNNQTSIEALSVNCFVDDSSSKYMTKSSLQTSNLSINDCEENTIIQSTNVEINGIKKLDTDEQSLYLDALEPLVTNKSQMFDNENSLESSIKSLIEDSNTQDLTNVSLETSNLSTFSSADFLETPSIQSPNNMIDQINRPVSFDPILNPSPLKMQIKDLSKTFEHQASLESISVESHKENSNIQFLTQNAFKKSNVSTFSITDIMDTRVNQSANAVIDLNEKTHLLEPNVLSTLASQVPDQIHNFDKQIPIESPSVKSPIEDSNISNLTDGSPEILNVPTMNSIEDIMDRSTNVVVSHMNIPELYEPNLHTSPLVPQVLAQSLSFDNQAPLESLSLSRLTEDANILTKNSLQTSEFSDNIETTLTQSSNVVINEKLDLDQPNLQLSASTLQVTNESQSLDNETVASTESIESTIAQSASNVINQDIRIELIEPDLQLSALTTQVKDRSQSLDNESSIEDLPLSNIAGDSNIQFLPKNTLETTNLSTLSLYMLNQSSAKKGRESSKLVPPSKIPSSKCSTKPSSPMNRSSSLQNLSAQHSEYLGYLKYKKNPNIKNHVILENENLENLSKYSLKSSMKPKNKYLRRSNSNLELNCSPLSSINDNLKYSRLSDSNYTKQNSLYTKSQDSRVLLTNHKKQSSLYAKTILNNQKKNEESKIKYIDSKSSIPKPLQTSKNNANSNVIYQNLLSNDITKITASDNMSRLKKPTQLKYC